MKVEPYDFKNIEAKIQAYWQEKNIFKADNKSQKPKKYILCMFPYPSGTGLHVGHMLSFHTGDTQSLYARMKGYEVLNAIGIDGFGLPAEQHAIDTGEHPATVTKKNTANYERLLKRSGICFDWDRFFSTTDADYYHWTQWLFLLFYDSWYDKVADKAQPIALLREKFEQEGNRAIDAACDEETPLFTAAEWQAKTSYEQTQILLYYRLAYRRKTNVNWCPELGTVLANDEVKDGHSERGGYPVVQKKMMQWHLRMTAYADRLLQGLEGLDWPASVKIGQRQWIGRSEGATIHFDVEQRLGDGTLEVFTTRIETLYGVSYLALAPEHPLVERIIAEQEAGLSKLTTAEKKSFKSLKTYVTRACNTSERARQQRVKEVSGCFTHFYALHPITQQRIPIWVADYVLGGYGSGAVMGVPAHDDRDHRFAKHFDLPIIQVIKGKEVDITAAAYTESEGVLINSGSLEGRSIPDAKKALLAMLIKLKKGSATVSIRLRDAIFGRQRYWGEAIPIYYRNGLPHPLSVEDLPLHLPPVDAYKPNAAGDPPLSRAKNWHTPAGDPLELTTMPAWAGSNAYFLRYMDPHNPKALVGSAAVNYWQQVDTYIGGKEHTTGHLLYARFCTKFLADRGVIPIDEPFQSLINQGIIQHKTAFAYRIKNTNQFVSYGKKERYETIPFRVPIHLVQKNVLDQAGFKAWRAHLADATFILEKGQYICGQAMEKMSKSKHNVIDPQQIITQYGSDVLKLHLFFLGPIRQSKPWSTEGIEGLVRFQKKIWRLFRREATHVSATQPPAQAIEKIIQKAIQKVIEGLERYTFNTSLSALMICTNQLRALPSCPPARLKDFLRLLAPFAPHMAEWLWQELGETESIFKAGFPAYDPTCLAATEVTYPVAVNGKKRGEFTLPADRVDVAAIKNQVVALPALQRWLAGKTIANIIVVPQRMINIVLEAPAQ
ncbi:MAG: leucine--tRNA ligase [Cytophagales bacterium]